MKKLALMLVLITASAQLFAQQPDFNTLYANARTFMMQGDLDNASLVYSQLLTQQPNNFDIQKDYAYLLVLKRDFAKAIELAKVLTESQNADVQSFQILGIAYKEIADNSECKKMYKRALAKFPNSGVLHNELGELLAAQKDENSAISEWEEGIKLDPNYSVNYFNASMFYAQQGNIFWSIIYGEIFVNLESYTQRTAAIKALLLDNYKRLFTLINSGKSSGKKSEFELTITNILTKYIPLASEGITTEQLLAIRTRFILDFFYGKYNEQFPFRLFDHQQYLLKEGLFEAYNQWIFGAATSPSAYQNWLDKNAPLAAEFKKFQQSRVYKNLSGQYYKGK